MPFNQWTFDSALPSPLLRSKVQVLGELRLPPNTDMDNSSSISRYLTDETSTRPLIQVNSNIPTNGFLSHGHSHHSHPAMSWVYPSSYQESTDASSAVSSHNEYGPYSANETAPTSSWTGSPDGHHFPEAKYPLEDTSPTSPGYPHGPTSGGRHSQRSSIDECLLPPQGLDRIQQTWGNGSGCSAGSSSDRSRLDVDPDAISTGADLSHQGPFVNLKSIQLTPADEGKDEEKYDDATERSCLNHRPDRGDIPNIHLHGPEQGGADTWPNEHDYYMEEMEIDCDPSSSYPSPQLLPRSATMLGARRERRSRASSGASQISAKSRAEMMKPFKDSATGSTGKSHKGRGAGKKYKERQSCPEHPSKIFKHNSDFRYTPSPAPLLSLPFLSTRVDQLTTTSSRSKHMQTQHTRPFLCTFYFAGCSQTFGSKNEWKRHVFSQHLQLHYWRCDHEHCADRKAIFNRKDLFGQHLKRMHGPKATSANKNSQQMKDWLNKEIPQIQERCLKKRRSPPEWSKCGYCHTEFKGEGSWDTRMEHVGKHYEKNNYKNIDPKAWVMDEGLTKWAIEVGIVEKTGPGSYKLLGSGKDSIEGEEKRKNQTGGAADVLHDDGEQDAEGDDE